jgi:CRISPR type I-A-associated protein Csa5
MLIRSSTAFEKLVKIVGQPPENLENEIRGAVEDIAKMLSRFVWARQYSFVDRIANAASKETVSITLYEALRISKSTLDAGQTLDENIRPYIAREESVKLLLNLLDVDLVSGLEIVRRAAILALSWRSSEKDSSEKGGGEY